MSLADGTSTSAQQLQLAYPFTQLPFATSAIIVCFLSLLYLTYQWALPKPLPGIPYNKEAQRTLLGDAAEIRKIRKVGGSPRAWFTDQTEKHKSPIVQAFLAPFSKPIVILSDFREAQDLLLRRGKEFDRSSRNVDSLGGVLENHHIAMKTSDPKFRGNRELIKDLMTPHFLTTVSAPDIYNNASKMIELWKFKTQLANGRPFFSMDDIHTMTFDIIKVVALGDGDNQSMTQLYLDALRSSTSADQQSGAGKDDVFVFPKNVPNEDLHSHEIQQVAISNSMISPFPKLFHAINNQTATMKQAYASKWAMLARQISLAVKRMEAGDPVKSALDYMIQRELAAAKKAGRAPDSDSVRMKDELYGYIGAGHDTSSTTLLWTLKYLAIHQDVQRKLRDGLRAAYPAALNENRQPSLPEMTKTSVPYLEAVIEEVLRLSGPVRTVMREATIDTTLLGHPIPKGTQVFLNLGGPSITSPSQTVDESKRSETCKASQHKRASWDGFDPEKFIPERWLKIEEVSEQAQQVFDAQAGPFLSFSLGVRGCFGRRLAYLELRIVVALLVWNFVFGELPAELNTWERVDALTTKPVTSFVRLAAAV